MTHQLGLLTHKHEAYFLVARHLMFCIEDCFCWLWGMVLRSGCDWILHDQHILRLLMAAHWMNTKHLRCCGVSRQSLENADVSRSFPGAWSRCPGHAHPAQGSIAKLDRNLDEEEGRGTKKEGGWWEREGEHEEGLQERHKVPLTLDWARTAPRRPPISGRTHHWIPWPKIS